MPECRPGTIQVAALVAVSAVLVGNLES